MFQPDPATQQKLTLPPSPAERRRIRRASVLAGTYFALMFLAGDVASRLGWWRGLPWIQTQTPGPLTGPWWLRAAAVSLAAGAMFGYLLGKRLRFPDTPPGRTDA